jgi:hypothetical protein
MNTILFLAQITIRMAILNGISFRLQTPEKMCSIDSILLTY